MESNIWYRCSDECYPTDEDEKSGVIIIAYKIEDEEETWCYWIYGRDCPYGWNILCRSTAYWIKIVKPFEK